MDAASLGRLLAGLDLGSLRYFDTIGSTNEEAVAWAAAGAPDLALVVADEQTAGKGRMGRRWFTPAGAALAFSLVLRPEANQSDTAAMALTALGALALRTALQREYGLQAKIKWPNDVLLAGRKTAGILVESIWQADRLQASILGIGVNVGTASLPPEDQTAFPATCIEAVLGRSLDRWRLLRTVLKEILAWRPQVGKAAFLQAWEEALAWRGEWVVLHLPQDQDGLPAQGQLLGLQADGALRLRDRSGHEFFLHGGEIRLPAES